jgi:precorrin-2/cobalt-factor-2 C20-methyltransferase
MSILYGVSVGTGDKELITLKALNTVKNCGVIAYIHSPNKQSMALEIIDEYITDDKIHIAIEMPMEKNTKNATYVYDNACKKIKQHLIKGISVAFLCEGDAMFYGSFMYVNERIKQQHSVKTISGINSVSACTASLGFGLVSRNEILSVIPAGANEDKIITTIKNSDAIAILKTNNNINKIKKILSDLNLLNKAICIINASSKDEQIIELNKLNEIPYFTTIIIKKNKDFY